MRDFAVRLLAILCLPAVADIREPVDWVNPEMGNISHLLVPCYPTVQRPNGMMRFLPPNADFVAAEIDGFSLGTMGHRARRGGGFCLQPWLGDANPLETAWRTEYDQVHVTPYRYGVRLDAFKTCVDYASAEKSAVFAFSFEAAGQRAVILSSQDKEGFVSWEDGALTGCDRYRGRKVWLYAEFDRQVMCAERRGRRLGLSFGEAVPEVRMRYAFSLLSLDQAQRNLRREMPDFDVNRVAAEGRRAWNDRLGLIRVEGGTDDEKSVFYTSLWRTFERMVDFTEEGRYLGWDGKVHDAGSSRYYNDDWVWDTFRAHHPLMALLQPAEEGDKLTSYVRMAVQSADGWMPTFPTIGGDAHSMNGFHTVSLFLDAWRKGVRTFDLSAAYAACAKTMRETTKVPWLRGPKNELDAFYDRHGYFPALREGEKETVPGVKKWEKRQAVAVTLAASFDAWCLAEMAKEVGDAAGEAEFRAQAANYRNLWKPDTQFFHPKDKDGKWIEPFDYKFSGGIGSRAYYDENNAWTYLWDVQHDLSGLIELFGGRHPFLQKLNRLFSEPLGCRRFEWPAVQPDSTAMMGQFSMGNEPSFHIPYLFAVAGDPAKTQKKIRHILASWFRNDLMGVPGDEDGGGMSAFVVFSMLGFYPVTPGLPEYVIGSPVFTRAEIRRAEGPAIVLLAPGSSRDRKYVKSVTVGGRRISGVWLSHDELVSGKPIAFEMSLRPKIRDARSPVFGCDRRSGDRPLE